MAEIKQTTNVVNVVGVLVKNGLECKVNSKGADYIGGSLVLRTNDGSEHQIDYYANKPTKEGKESGLLSMSSNCLNSNARVSFMLCIMSKI